MANKESFPWANPGTDSQFPANCAGNLVSVPGLRALYSRAELVEQRALWKRQGKTVVFTNGCYDLLHPGHVRLLEQARSLGDALGMATAGLAIGVPVALWARQFAASLIPGLPLNSVFPITFSAVAMLAIAVLAAWLPARRAARVDPVNSLRYE